ncbi:hypothetical protein CEXT_607551 [Caerostris extrusa]|uniref:Secreted protein n=1 Tax=Caerostris extrusa TaxID=172846 RepID=A0AAV4VMN1_CAEEX|nr:hypothetical protein CEXT_607551 [Caerostris extrusa]
MDLRALFLFLASDSVFRPAGGLENARKEKFVNVHLCCNFDRWFDCVFANLIHLLFGKYKYIKKINVVLQLFTFCGFFKNLNSESGLLAKTQTQVRSLVF